MALTLSQTTVPTSEPITVDDVKSYLRIDHHDEDILLSTLIATAREDVERFLRRQIMTATWKLYLDDWPSGQTIRPPYPPLQSVTSIAYTDSDGVSQTLNASLYQVDIISQPGRICPSYSQVWPTVRGETVNAITITYKAGYANIGAVPKGIKMAILLLIGDMYEHRESQLETKVEQNNTVIRLLWNWRLLEAA